MIRVFIFNLFIALCCVYFGFHLIWGQRGYIRYKESYSVFENKIAEFSSLEAQRVVLEKKNSLFESSALDLDALDEYVRRVLAIASKNDSVIPVKKLEPKN